MASLNRFSQYHHHYAAKNLVTFEGVRSLSKAKWRNLVFLELGKKGVIQKAIRLEAEAHNISAKAIGATSKK